LPNLPLQTPPAGLVRPVKHPRIIEQAALELKQELGHFEGRSWQGFHDHGTRCVADAFAVAERSRFSVRVGQLELAHRCCPPPTGSAAAGRQARRHKAHSIASLRELVVAWLMQ